MARPPRLVSLFLLLSCRGSLQRRRCAIAWEAWATLTAGRLRALRMLRMGVSRIMRRQVSHAWASWDAVMRDRTLQLRLLQRFVLLQD